MTNRHRRAQDLGTLMQLSGDGAARHGTTLILMYETGAVAIWIERSEMGHEGSEAHAGELLTRNGVVPGFTRHCARWGPPTSARLSKSHFSRGARWPVVYDWRQLSKRGRAGTPGTGPADGTRPPAGRMSGPTPHWIMLMQRQVGNAATAAYVQADVEQPPLAVRAPPRSNACHCRCNPGRPTDSRSADTHRRHLLAAAARRPADLGQAAGTSEMCARLIKLQGYVSCGSGGASPVSGFALSGTVSTARIRANSSRPASGAACASLDPRSAERVRD